MLLTIHNLPGHMRFADVKDLIREKCGLTELILDNLINEGNGKRVTVGLADEGDAALLVRKMNGLFMSGAQLYVEDVRQKKQSEQPFRSTSTSTPQQKWPQPPKQQAQTFEPPKDMQYQQQMGFVNQPVNQLPVQPVYNSLPYYMTQAQSSQVTYDALTPMSTNPLQQAMFYQQDMTSYMYQQPGTQNQWNKEAVISYPQKSTLATTVPTKSDDRFSQNDDRKRDAGKDNRNFPRESNWKDKDQFEPYRGDKDFRNRSSERYDNKGFRPNALKEQEDVYRYEKQPSPRSRDRFENRPVNKGDVGRNSDFQSSSRSSRFERSPSRNRPSQRESSPPSDRFRSRGSPERGSKYHGFDDQEDQQIFRRRDDSRDFGKYDHDRGFNETERKNDRQGSFGPKRPYPNLSEKPQKTYGNDPNNSTFSKSNVNIFRQQPQKKSFEMQNRKSDINLRGPPAKVSRFSKDGGYVAAPRGGQPGMNMSIPTGNIPKNAPSESIKEKLMKHSIWREHAAGILAGKVIANANVNASRIKNYKEVVQNLRKCIMSRIDVILGDQIVNSLNEMIDSYRQKFSVQDDAGFYKAVLEKLERDSKESPRGAPGPGKKKGKNFPGPLNNRGYPNQNDMYRNPGKPNQLQQSNANNPFANKPNQKQFSNKQKKGPNVPNQNKNVPPQQQFGRLPKYPEANKQVYKDQKKIQKMEFQDEVYTLEPVLQNALVKEMESLCGAFVSACTDEPSTDKDEETVREKLMKTTVKQFEKVVKVHLTKRLLDIRTNLIVRIFAAPKPPKRDDMDAFLKNFGAVNLKKSDRKKMFMATCDSYESFDKLIALKSTKIGDSEVSFKPLHLIGPPEKRNRRGQNQHQEDDEMITEEENDEAENFKDDIVINNDEFVVDETVANMDDFNTSQDVVLIENEKEVVVIEDSDHKDTVEKTDSTEELKNNDSNNVETNNETSINENKESNFVEPSNVQGGNVDVNDILNSADIDFAEDDLEDF